jgi:predicted metal-dependent phosphoesterase TrpH
VKPTNQPARHDSAFESLIPGAGKADIHIHTNASDGGSSAKDVLEYVEHHTDMDVIAIADHDTLDGALEAKRIHAAGNYRFELIVAEEVTSTAGHILGLFLDKEIPKERSPRETIELIHAQGGLAIAAHPLLILKYIDPDMLTADGVGIDVLMSEQFDAIEIINGGPTMKNVNSRARLLNRSLLFRAEIGSSDAHIPEAIGKGYTLFPGKTAEDFRRAIEQKTTEAVSTKYHVMELLKYLKLFMKMKVRETGKRIFRRKRDRRERT